MAKVPGFAKAFVPAAGAPSRWTSGYVCERG
jgi:hypothetical protein